MNMKSILCAILLLAFATAAAAQNSVKLFDATPIGASDPNVLMNADPYGNFKTAEVYLSCPTGGYPTSSLSGPNGGELIVDNALTINRSYVRMGNWFSFAANPGGYVGMPVEMAYGGISPVNVGAAITATGLYTFHLIDWGYTYGSSEIYLNTSCAIVPIITPGDPPSTPSSSVLCHRNNGNNGGQRTLTVGAAAVAAHLAHGDTLGACAQ